MVCGSGGSKSRLTKAVEPCGQMRDEKSHAVVARSTFPSQNAQNTLQLRSTFRSCDVEKVHAVVPRSTFASQNVQNTPASEHLWKLRCSKSARPCGAKHMSKSKVLKTDGFGAFLEVAHAVVARSTFSKCTKHTTDVRATFGRWSVILCGRCQGFCTLLKVRNVSVL